MFVSMAFFVKLVDKVALHFISCKDCTRKTLKGVLGMFFSRLRSMPIWNRIPSFVCCLDSYGEARYAPWHVKQSLTLGSESICVSLLLAALLLGHSFSGDDCLRSRNAE